MPRQKVAFLGSPTRIHTSEQLLLPAPDYSPPTQGDVVLPTPSAKHDWLDNEMLKREDEYVTKSDVSVFVGTWNVNGKKPPETLAGWLLTTETPADIYAIGFQELDLTAGALIAVETAKGKVWEQTILKTLNEIGHYVLLMSKQLVGMLLVVAIREDQLKFVKHARDTAVPVGLLGVMGNKGAVSIRFQYHDSTFCFVNSHLSAHQDQVFRRNQDFRDISRLIQFSTTSESSSLLSNTALPLSHASPPLSQHSRSLSLANLRNSTDTGRGASPSTTALRPIRTPNNTGSDIDMWTIYSHHHLFWLGDLNYRIDLPNETIRQAIDRADWAALFAADQLNIQKNLGQVFNGFTEGSIAFAPTYKYDNLSTLYDTSEKARLPAWTDRVLWKGKDITLRSYRRHELLTSDHRPVSAVFSSVIKSVILQKRHEVYRNLIRKIDKFENESIPDVRVSEKEIVFGDIEYDTPVSRTIIIKNIGHVIAPYRFIAKNEQQQICKPWVTLSPPKGILLQNEEVELTITIHVKQDTAGPLNLGSEELSDIVVLHLDRGKDEYLVITGNYLSSCFGSPLEHLVRFPGAIRTTKPLSETSQLLPIPKEVWLLVDYLLHTALEEAQLFLTPGTPEEIRNVRNLLDMGLPLHKNYSGSCHSVAQALLALLSSFPTPVFPPNLYERAIGNCDNPDACFEIVKSLPPVSYNLFHYLISFLRELLLKNPTLDPHSLANVFAPILMHLPQSSRNFDQYCVIFFLYFLNYPS